MRYAMSSSFAEVIYSYLFEDEKSIFWLLKHILGFKKISFYFEKK